MRKKEVDVSDLHEIEELLHRVVWGILTFHGKDDWPYSVPLNYVYSQKKIYLHSATTGEKIECLHQNDKVQFSVVEDFSLIPSYFSGQHSACHATQFFKSVMIFGYANIVSSTSEQVDALKALMMKLQPEGKYNSISEHDNTITANLKRVVIICITPVKMTAKFKFGQNLPEQKVDLILEHLEKRGTEKDRQTIDMIHKYRPNNS